METTLNSHHDNSVAPFSLRVNEAAKHFGLASQTIYQWINTGKLIRGKHYLKVGKPVCIVREEFIKFMYAEDGTNVG